MASAEWQGKSPGSDKVKWHAIPSSSPPPHHHHAKDENTVDFANESQLSSPCPVLGSACHTHISLKHAPQGGGRWEWRKAKENVLFLTFLPQRSHRFLSEVSRQMTCVRDRDRQAGQRRHPGGNFSATWDKDTSLKKKVSFYINRLLTYLYLGLSLYLCFAVHFSNPED